MRQVGREDGYYDPLGRTDLERSARWTPDRWQRGSELFLSALEQDETSRRRFVEEAAAGDPELLHEVEQLLASDAQAGTFMAAAVAGDPWRSPPMCPP